MTAPEDVLTKSLVRAVTILRIDQTSLANILSASENSISLLLEGKYRLSKENIGEWNASVAFVRMYQLLRTILPSNDMAVEWLSGPNLALGDKPRHIIERIGGLERVNAYLQAQCQRI